MTKLTLPYYGEAGTRVQHLTLVCCRQANSCVPRWSSLFAAQFFVGLLFFYPCLAAHSSVIWHVIIKKIFKNLKNIRFTFEHKYSSSLRTQNCFRRVLVRWHSYHAMDTPLPELNYTDVLFMKCAIENQKVRNARSACTLCHGYEQMQH